MLSSLARITKIVDVTCTAGILSVFIGLSVHVRLPTAVTMNLVFASIHVHQQDALILTHA